MDFNFSKLEKKILRFWKKKKVFEKSIEQGKKAPNFVFYEGPPTANAPPGLHHVLARVFKDIICRYKTMRGFRVLRKAGWDTHGLPVELEIEQKLGLKSKKEIEKYGIAKFNKKCRESVWQYKKDWERLTERIAFWLDMENPYITYQPDYIETVWWILKQIWQKGLLFQDYKVSPYCPRCQTVLSSHEVAQGYERIKEPAIYLKFSILNPEFKNTFLLVWTTTPWTLPANVAVAVNPNFIYAKVKVNKEYLILAKERIKPSGIKGKIIEEFKGKNLIGLKYSRLFNFATLKHKNKKIYEVVRADFVSLKEGTGLVHIAPAFGEDDMELIRTQNSKLKTQNLPEFPILLTVDEEGKFTSKVKKWAGMFVKEADPLILEDLKNRDLLFKEELYEHDYPFCWRCHSPLLYYAKESWFIRMTKVKKDLIRNNQKINWIPAHLKEGRFGQWLREIKDWALTRERYWGTPLPIWRCQTGICNNIVVIGSKQELLNQKFSTNRYFILRHGETIHQTEKKKMTYPRPENPAIILTKNGEKQIKLLAKKLRKIDLIYASDFPRTRQTAQIIAKELAIRKIKFDKRLGDINLGIYHGRKKEQLYRAFPKIEERFYRKPPRGESWSDCRKRMINFIGEIDKKHQGKTILIVSHGDPLWLLEGTLKGLTNEELIKQKLRQETIGTGEIRELKFTILPLNKNDEIDFHRPYIDEVKFYCPVCQEGLMKRTPEVIDCWFDSGSMPFAQAHWPFAFAQNQKSKIKNQKFLFPADYISEGIDQTRGWFYTLLAISTLLAKGPAYKNVISLGHVLDEKGEKMSKSKGNVVEPWSIIEKYGVDSTRWYFYTINQPSDSKLFSEKDVASALKKFILTFWHSFLFYQTYREDQKLKIKNQKSKNILDQWILSRLNNLIQETTKLLDQYAVTSAARAIESFVINDLSLWYIRRSRRRFQKPANKKELKMAAQTLGFILLTTSKLTAPFIPFLSEEINQRLTSGFKLSVHLEDWPKVDKKLLDKNLEEKMKKLRKIVAQALNERAKAGIKVRQPLAVLKIKNKKLKIKNRDLLNLIKEEVNVKEIVFDDKIKKEVELATKITPELKEEGMVREVIRNIQEMRKTAGFKPKDKILVNYFGRDELKKILEKNKKIILKETLAKDFSFVLKPKEKLTIKKEIKFDGKKFSLGIKKL